jgi:glycosyltransferase involved in cell wall biosynthesis
MTTRPLVSIITPAYNHAGFIERCVDGVLSQTYADWEQIVVDDGSTDRTAEIVASYRDPRVRCLQLPHRGLGQLADSYNAALAVSRGTLVAILEGDDAWPAHRLETQVPMFHDPGVFLSWGRAAIVDENDVHIRKTSTVATSREHVDFDAREVFAWLTRTNALIPSVSVMVRRSALDVLGGFRQTGSSLYVDLPTWLSLTAVTTGRVRFVNRELAYYRVHGNQTTQHFRRRMDAEHLQVVRAVVDQLNDETRQRVGWASLERDAVIAGFLAEGLGSLHERDYASARSCFRRALSDAGDWKNRMKAAVGLISGTIHVNLLSAAYRLRELAFAARRETVPAAGRVPRSPRADD